MNLSSPRGFTLLELLLASTLITLILLAVATILTRFAVDPTLPASTDRPAQLEAVFDLLERDLAMADVIRWESDGSLVLEGLVGLDGVTRERRDLPARVRYVLDGQGDERALLRMQRGYDGVGFVDVLVWGAGSVLLEPGLKRTKTIGNGSETGAQLVDYPAIDLNPSGSALLIVRDSRMLEELSTAYSAASAWRVRLADKGGTWLLDRWAVVR
ncbi:prepilin-type N-terminal cleavage/methylation domain-containing protein [Mucisphaera sp.]|uniref:prepilin-type N-terminal cleavage/methylation domain-containing protein n=1 Tax=Mucisphaera sp. TaxID=2913024 RepID=UPI003D13373F